MMFENDPEYQAGTNEPEIPTNNDDYDDETQIDMALGVVSDNNDPIGNNEGPQPTGGIENGGYNKGNIYDNGNINDVKDRNITGNHNLMSMKSEERPYSSDYKNNKKPVQTAVKNALKKTRLSDIFSPYFILQFFLSIILCIICICFIWVPSLLLDINLCRIGEVERAKRNLRYAPFGYGIQQSFLYSLLIIGGGIPFLMEMKLKVKINIIIMVTVLSLLWLFQGIIYGFIAKKPDLYTSIVLLCLCYILLQMLTYFKGFYIYYMGIPIVFSFLITLLIVYLIHSLLFNVFPKVAFAIIFPIYLTVLESIALKLIEICQIPYHMCEKYVNIICCLCVSKELRNNSNNDNNNDNNMSSMHIQATSASGEAITPGGPDDTTPGGPTDGEIIDMDDNDDDDDFDGMMNSNNKSKNKKQRKKKKKGNNINENEDQVLSIKLEDMMTNEFLYFVCGVIIIIIEVTRIVSILQIRNYIGLIILNVILTLFIEILQRNNLFNEIYYKYICRDKYSDNDVPHELTRLGSMYLGNKIQCQYLSLIILIIFNIFNYGPHNPSDCNDDNNLNYLLRINDNNWEQIYVIIIIFALYILMDILTELLKLFGIKLNIFGMPNENGLDPARDAIYLKLKFKLMIPCFLGFLVVAIISFNYYVTLNVKIY